MFCVHRFVPVRAARITHLFIYDTADKVVRRSAHVKENGLELAHHTTYISDVHSPNS